MSSPFWKVYNPEKKYIAAFVHAADAASLVALYGDGTTIRADHRLIMWTEGKESQPAAESYDHVHTTCHKRLQAYREKKLGQILEVL